MESIFCEKCGHLIRLATKYTSVLHYERKEHSCYVTAETHHLKTAKTTVMLSKGCSTLNREAVLVLASKLAVKVQYMSAVRRGL